jgi:hypothetical protein
MRLYKIIQEAFLNIELNIGWYKSDRLGMRIYNYWYYQRLKRK